MIPRVVRIATIILLGPSLSYLLLTLEQNTPTRITLTRLHDLAIIMNG
jgi:hypothetical protein